MRGVAAALPLFSFINLSLDFLAVVIDPRRAYFRQSRKYASKRHGMTEEAPATTRIHIWSDPDSKIPFMETLLKGQTWEAVVHHPGGHAALKPIQERFQTRRFSAELGHDEHRQPMLTLRHFGDETNLLTACRELGLVRGFRHTFTSMGERLGSLLNRAKRTVHTMVSDSARLLALMYLAGDLILTFAGLGQAEDDIETALAEGRESLLPKALGKLSDPVNFLKSMAGVFATLQSLIFIRFAKGGEELMLEELLKQSNQALKEGKSLAEVEQWLADQGRDDVAGAFKGIQGALSKYPIQAGSLAQIAGQVMMLGAGFIRRQRYVRGLEGAADEETRNAILAKKRSGEMDMLAGLSSATGWLATMYPEKHHDTMRPWSDPRRLWQEFETSPHKSATFLLAGASAAGIAGSLKENPVQAGAYLTYLLGDALMFVTRASDYGGKAVGDEAVAGALATFMTQFPVVAGPAYEAKMLEGAARQLARRIALTGREDRQETLERDPEFAKQVEEQTGRIVTMAQTRLMGKSRPFDQVALGIAAMAARFSADDRSQMAQQLCALVSGASSVAATTEELGHKVQELMAGLNAAPRARPVTVEELTADAARLVNHIPGFATPENVSDLYDLLATKARTLRADEEKLGRAVVATGAKQIGMPSPVPMPSLGGFAISAA